jgi:Tfp pilus assembly protein PilF
MLQGVRKFLLGCVFCLVAAAVCAADASSQRDMAIRLNNLGVAYMNQQNMEKAEQTFSEAFRKDPSLLTAELNRGIALLNLQKLAEARQTLQHVVDRDPGNVAAWYNLGLLSRNSNSPQETIRDFQRVLQLDPSDADAHYFLGSSYMQQKNYADAILQFQKALQLNPIHASAEFGLARALQQSGNMDAAKQHFERFEQMTSAKIASPLTLHYGEMGRYSIAQSIHQQEPEVGAMIPLRFLPQNIGNPRFWRAAALPAEANGGGACILRLGENGELGLIALSHGAHAIHTYLSSNTGKFQELSPEQTGLDVSGDAIACTVGDFDNDGLPDVAVSLSDRVVLFKNLGEKKFADVTKAAGIQTLNQPAGLTFVDYDHDGDLDLFVTGKAIDALHGPNVLWRNNGNGTFTDWTSQAGLNGEKSTSNATLSDLNNDRAVDLVVTGSGAAPTFFANPREGHFHASPLYPDIGLSPTNGVYVFDFNKDGWMDVAVTHTGAPGVTLWRNVDGKRFERVPLPLLDATRGWGLTALDIDNDGWIDLAVLVETSRGPQLRILRNRGARGFEDVTAAVGLAHLQLHQPRAVLAADVDRDGDADLLVTQLNEGPVLLRNDGGNRNHWLRLSLQGLADNKSALGTKVEIFAGSLWQKWEVAGAAGYMGQGSPEILAGLGQQSQVDIVRMLWPTGVLQDELNLPADKPASLRELDRRGSSCPVLFAWDGTRYRFVSDVIGAAVVGHWVSPTATNTPDPGEWIKVNGNQLQPRFGYLSLRFGEPMEEVNFIDQLRLVAVDHPAGIEVYPNERFLSHPPFPDGRVIAASAAHPLVAAWDDHGRDVRELLRNADHRYVRDFTNLPFAGFANLHTLTLDIGPWTPRNPLHLLLRGYIEYFSASSMYAAWQAGLQPQPPTLEAQMPDGTWKRVLDDMGFPAGLPRTIPVDLTGKLPPGVHRLRIVTNLQIYWDRILIDNGPDRTSQVRTTELPLSLSTLEFRGYPQQVEGKTPGDLTYRYDRISNTGPFARQRGEYTRYGNVTPLLQRVDDQFAIFGSGEDIDAEFSTDRLPPLPPHWQRDYFFYANGFVKDMDFYEASPFTVGALPFHSMRAYPYAKTQTYPMDSASVKYRLQWNDRFDSGNSAQRYRFHYLPAASSPILPASVSHPARANSTGSLGGN